MALQYKAIPLLKGALKHIPGMKRFLPTRTGGSFDSRYCYAVWMRHLLQYRAFKAGMPESVAELGPGDSLGIGLSSLLCGSSRLYALDVIEYWNADENVGILDQLVELFRSRTQIPDEIEFPDVKPTLTDYGFPHEIIPEALLDHCLSTARIDAIRRELRDPSSPNNEFVRSMVPWHGADVIKRDSLDFIFSQAVLEHIEDLEGAYHAMCAWLKPDGLMSHTVDFKSHGITIFWNGHWLFSDLEWRIVRGGRPFLLNRRPLSNHLELLAKSGFQVLNLMLYKRDNSLSRRSLAAKFAEMTDEDLATCGMHVLAGMGAGPCR